MVRDEAPAATHRWHQRKGIDRAAKSNRRHRLFGFTNGPVSLVAAEIHLGSTGAIHSRRMHCNIQVACHIAGMTNRREIRPLEMETRTGVAAAPPMGGRPPRN
jgi:hypothetical protein